MAARQKKSFQSAATVVLLALAGCDARQPQPEPSKAVEPPRPAAAPAVRLPAPSFVGRAELLAAMDLAASAYAAGEPPPETVRALSGGRLLIRLPLGCRGPAGAEADSGVAWDPKAGTIRVFAQPQDWTNASWAPQLAPAETVEAVEGFWIRRPWLRSEGCPAVQASAEAVKPPLSQYTVGVAQVFEAGGSRLQRRGNRPYEVKLKRKGEQQPALDNYRLVLQGRIGGSSDQAPIACRAEHPDQRPICLIRVDLDRIAIEAGGQPLAEWKS